MTTYRIKDIAYINRKTLSEHTDPEKTFRYIDIRSINEFGKINIPNERITFAAAPSRARRLAPPDSVVISTVRTYLRAIASVPTTKDQLVFSTGFAVLEAGPKVDARYLAYYCHSQAFVDEVVARSVGVSYPAINASEIGNIPIKLPSIDEQHRIADFLDAETGRLESIISLRRRMRELLELKREHLVTTCLGLDSQEEINFLPLKFLVREVTVGIVITPSKWYVESGGVPALRGVNIERGKISLNNLVRISEEGHAANRKSQLQEGDLVAVRTGQAGVAAVVPPDLHGANCIDLVVIRPGPRLNSRFAEYVLNSDYARRHVNEFSVGTIQSHFNVAAMKQMPVPAVSLKEQKRRVEALDAKIEIIDKLSAKLKQQEALLTERKRTLITAAVTGQIDVTTARGVVVS